MLGKGWFAKRNERRENYAKERRARKWRAWLEEGTGWVREMGGGAEEVKRTWRRWLGEAGGEEVEMGEVTEDEVRDGDAREREGGDMVMVME